MNGREYSEWQMQVSQQLSTISQKLDSFKDWTVNHDSDKKELIKRVDSLEHSRTWINGSLYTLWLFVSAGIIKLFTGRS